MSGFVGMAGFSTYAPTKFALRGLADCLRNEVGLPCCPLCMNVLVMAEVHTDQGARRAPPGMVAPAASMIPDFAKAHVQHLVLSCLQAAQHTCHARKDPCTKS